MKQIILSPFTVPNGAVLGYHAVQALEIKGATALVLVNSYRDLAMGQLAWQDRYAFPFTALSENPEASVAQWLISAAGTFSGGTLLDPNAAAIEQERTRLRIAVKARRDAAEWAGVMTAHGAIDSDPDSQRKISGAVTMAVVEGPSFSIDWRMQDNSIVTLDQEAMIAVGVAVGLHVAACQARKTELDAEIAAAFDVEALQLVPVNLGWPA